MSETNGDNESYEQLVARLKPFSVVVTRLSAERVSQLKVVDDPNRINDEPKPSVAALTEDEDIEEFEEIYVDLNEAEARVKTQNESNDNSSIYSCFICQKAVKGYNETVAHLQLHIDYYPIQCAICDEANIDISAFVSHCRKAHPDVGTVKYIHKPNSNCSNWIRDFLTSIPDSPFKDKPHKYCPACDWVKMAGDPNSTVSDQSAEIKPLQIIRHIHEHINYMPNSCTKCREVGRDFRAHCLDQVVRKHVATEHKELSPPFWRHFNKKYSIPSLDKFIEDYLKIFDIKMYKRRNYKKKKPPLEPTILTNQTPVVTPPVVSVVSNSSHLSQLVTNQSLPNQIQNHLLQLMQKPVMSTVTIPGTNLLAVQPSNTYQTYSLQSRLQTTSSNVVYAPNGSVTYLQMQSPLQMLPSNDKVSNALYMEATDLGVVSIDPSIYEIDDRFFEYICVFCEESAPKKYTSAIDMCVHYGIHFDYNPVVCMLCDKRFQDLSTLTTHYNIDHNEYKNNIFHYLKEDDKIEKWIKAFVDFQKTHFFDGYVSARFGDYCFVCEKLAKDESTVRLKCNNINAAVIRDHINQHLHYFPYQCVVCLHGNRSVSFTSFNTSAIQHMWKLHADSKTTSHSELTKFLVKTNEIPILEKFIDNRLFPKRDAPETPIVLNLKRKLEEIEADTKKRLESAKLAAKALPALPSVAQVIPILRNDSPKKPEVRHLTPHLNSMLKQPTTISPHKVNGMSSFPSPSVHSIPKPTPKPIDYIPTRTTFVEPFLICFHCHQRVANTAELQSHHQTRHPKLTIASYTPTKRDLIA